TADQCTPLPADFVSFTIGDTPATIACHGAMPITFRAWSVACDGCNGYDTGPAQPAWLLQPSTNVLYLSPTEQPAGTGGGGWWSSVVLNPALKVDPAWRSAWVELTGHYDDPVSATCRTQPTADDLQWWQGREALVSQCRLTFGVTDMRVVGGHEPA